MYKTQYLNKILIYRQHINFHSPHDSYRQNSTMKKFLFLIQGKILCFEEQTWLRSHHTLDVNKKTHEGGWRGESGQRSVGVTPDNRYSAHRLCLLQVWTIPDVTPIKGSLKSLLRTAGCETWFFFFFFFDSTKP